MAAETKPSSGSSGGGLKYGLIGLLLIAAAVAVYFWATCDSEQVQPPPPPPDAGVQRSTQLAEPEIIIPEEEEDAGPLDAGPGATKIIYRYVDDGWSCTGDISAAAAGRVIGQYSRQVRSCYERALKSNHTLQGRVNVRVRVGANGAVSGVQVGGSLGDPTVFACIRNIASGWHFPPPTGGRCAIVSAPFSFTPRP